MPLFTTFISPVGFCVYFKAFHIFFSSFAPTYLYVDYIKSCPKLEGWPNMAARLAGWRRVTGQVWFRPWRTGRPVCLISIVPVALTEAAQLRAAGISSCCSTVKMYTTILHDLRHTRKEDMAWYSVYSRLMHAILTCRYLKRFFLSKTLFTFLNRKCQWTISLPCGQVSGVPCLRNTF